MMEGQQYLFGMDEMRPQTRRPSGGSGNPIVFRDYESFVAKFSDTPKTTDDCYTPRDVYDAVVEYVSTLTDMSGKVILRPFYPGGDYENAEYPENGVVIDNPPFSSFTKIVAFYTARDIPFFLFGPGLTIASACKYCTAVIVGTQITFENGALVRCNFATNLCGDTVVMTAPTLDRKITECKSQKPKNPMPSFEYPMEVLSVSDLQSIARNGIEFSVSREECRIIRDLDLHPKKGGLFGDHFLVSAETAQEKKTAKEFTATGEKVSIPIPLSKREQVIVSRLGKQ